jgi:hypothetical protein
VLFVQTLNVLPVSSADCERGFFMQSAESASILTAVRIEPSGYRENELGVELSLQPSINVF